MAEINIGGNDTSAGGRKRAGVRRVKKHSLRTDMTPMVDLGFLLIAFFVMTAEMSKPTVTNLIMPKESPVQTLVADSDALTVLLGENNGVFYYEGDWNKSLSEDKISQTTLSYSNGLGEIIRQKQKRLDADPSRKEGRIGLMLIIKPDSESAYKTLIDVLDEVMINNLKKYVITKPSTEEINWLKEQ
jgi:biopolymer transport protein ExbD